MGSPKKHKHESKKKKHRSRSRSPERSKERHRHHKRHHHKEKKREKKEKNGEYVSKYEDYDTEDDVIAVPPPPKISRPSTPPPPSISSSGEQSLSIEETNKLRARLGLKPLRVEEIPALTSEDVAKRKEREESGATMGGKDMGEFVHRPADNIAQKVQSDKMKQRLQERREKRLIESKLQTVKFVGDSDSEDEASAWVEKSRKVQAEREQAEKRAKMLEELDAEFGVGDLVEDEIRTARKQAYSASDLRGLKVEHAVDRFSEGKTVILTLKDSGVLEDGDDVLVNVNMIDDERYEKNVTNKKLKPSMFGYNVYEDNDVDEVGNIKKKEILSKYDDEIKGEKVASFAIGQDVAAEREEQALQVVRERLNRKRIETLSTPGLQIASDYYTVEEIDVKFKRTKKKARKIRKKSTLKADDLLPDVNCVGSDFGSRAQSSSATNGQVAYGPGGEVVIVKQEPEEDSNTENTHDTSEVKVEPDDGELELHLALKKARKLKQLENTEVKPSVEAVVQAVLENPNESSMAEGGSIVLNATAEFCRTLGDIPTYGLSGNRDENEQELLDFEKEIRPNRKRVDDDTRRGAWNEVEIDEKPVDVLPTEVPILDVEPDVGEGVAGALRLALSKGYLERENMNKPSASRFAHLQAQNYSIEDKTHIDDDKFGRRERYSGPTSDFKEKDSYKPNVKLDYIDDDGRVLNAKEAFRYLSHKFHGKGPGKNKVEKRMKKNEQEGLMKQMSSTDTPLGTLNLLQQKQRETQSAFVVLSGSKQATLISKTKL